MTFTAITINTNLCLVLDDQPVTEPLQQRAEASKPEIAIWDNKFLTYYRLLHKSINQFAKYSLLAELGIKPDNAEQLEVPTFCIDASGRSHYRLFIFSVLASDLVRFCYVARRQTGGENYYQRMIKQNRLDQIAEYINKGMIFPNSIVVALSQHTYSYVNTDVPSVKFPRWQSFGTLTLKDRFDTCWIIDGQHRLFAHTHTNTPGRLIVTAFANISEEKQAEYFLDINREAKKVDADLLWDLLDSTKPGSEEGIISKAVKSMRAISGGFFENNIKIPSIGSGKFSFNNICSAIQDEQLAYNEMTFKCRVEKNPIWNSETDVTASQLAKSLDQFLTTLNQSLTLGARGCLYSDGFVAVLISLFKLLVVHLHKRPSDVDFADFTAPLARDLNTIEAEEASHMRKGLTSKAGRADLRNQFVILLQSEYSKEFAVGLVPHQPSLAEAINDLEYDLNRLANNYLTSKHGDRWIYDQSILKNQDEIKKIRERSAKADREPWEYLNFSTTLASIVTNKTYWEDFFSTLFRQAGITTSEDAVFYGRKLWDYRSDKFAHKRSKPVIYNKEQENLTKNAYLMFKRAIQDGNSHFDPGQTSDEEMTAFTEDETQG